MKDETMEKLGTILTGGEQRDAVHVAVAPGIAAMLLRPGEHVGFVNNGDLELFGPKGCVGCSQPVGIVDPFLTKVVQPGQRFFVFLYPRTITSMRHEWTHPAFTPPPQQVADDVVRASLTWFDGFAKKHLDDNGNEYQVDDLIESGKNFLRNEGDIIIQRGDSTLRDETPAREFWHHFAIVTGIKVPGIFLDDAPFSCSC